MGMVPAQHIAHAGGGLPEGPVGGQVVLVHGVEDPPVDGLEAVPHIGKRPADNDRHGVLDVAGFHFVNKLRGDNGLIGVHNVLGLVVFLVLCQGKTSFIGRLPFPAVGWGHAPTDHLTGLRTIVPA